MTFLRRLTSIASWILRRDHAEQRLDDEIRRFVEMSTADKIREGVSPAEARRLALARVSRLVGAGIVVGLAVGAWTSRFVATLLFGLEPGDPGTLVASAATLALIGAVAGWLPAHRASRLDPTRILRDA